MLNGLFNQIEYEYINESTLIFSILLFVLFFTIIFLLIKIYKGKAK